MYIASSRESTNNEKITLDMLREERKWNPINYSIQSTESRKNVEDKTRSMNKS